MGKTSPRLAQAGDMRFEVLERELHGSGANLKSWPCSGNGQDDGTDISQDLFKGRHFEEIL